MVAQTARLTPALASSAASLGSFVATAAPAAIPSISAQLRKAGLGGLAPLAPVSLAAPATTGTDAVSAGPAIQMILDEDKSRALLTLAIASLAKIAESFLPLKLAVRRRLRLANRLKIGSEIITTVLSSSVVGSITLGGSPAVSTILGFFALVASLLTVVATGIFGDNPRVAEEFGEISARCEAANQLSDRLRVYEKEPSLFSDVEERLKEADDLKNYLIEKIETWGLKIL